MVRTSSMSAGMRLSGVGAALLLVSAAAGQDATVVGGWAGATHTDTVFEETGTVQNSKANDPATSITGTPESVTSFTGLLWKLNAAHDVATLNAMTADGVQLKLSGEHNARPHVGEALPNILPEIRTPAMNIAAGRLGHAFVWGGVPHPGRGDVDYYAIGGEIRNITLGAVTTVSADAHVEAYHTELDSNPFHEMKAFGKTSADGDTTMSYDPATRQLLISDFTPNVLDDAGGASGGIDPLYAGDAVLGAPVSISPIRVGPYNDGDVIVRTEPSRMSVDDPFGRFGLQGQIDGREHALPLHTMTFVLNGGGIFVSNDADADGPASPFLVDFGYSNVVGADDDAVGRLIILSLETPLTEPDILAATNGFTIEATLPVSVRVSASNAVQEPPPCEADLTGDGVADIFDLLQYLAAWFLGCDD